MFESLFLRKKETPRHIFARGKNVDDFVSESGLSKEDISQILSIIPPSSEVGTVDFIRSGFDSVINKEKMRIVKIKEEENKNRVIVGTSLTPESKSGYNIELTKTNGEWAIKDKLSSAA